MVAGGFDASRVRGAIHYMMVLNPMVEIYLLDAQGKIPCVLHGPVRPGGAKLRGPGAGEKLRRLRGSSSSSVTTRAARAGQSLFPPRPWPWEARQGYVYIILGGERYDATLRMIRQSYILSDRGHCPAPCASVHSHRRASPCSSSSPGRCGR